MKSKIIKISSVFFLAVLLISNFANLHIYLHNQIEEVSNNQKGDFDSHDDDKDKNEPCDICIIAFNLNNLDYNNTEAFSFKKPLSIQQYNQDNTFSYTEVPQKQLYFNNNKNKAPPHLV